MVVVWAGGEEEREQWIPVLYFPSVFNLWSRSIQHCFDLQIRARERAVTQWSLSMTFSSHLYIPLKKAAWPWVLSEWCQGQSCLCGPLLSECILSLRSPCLHKGLELSRAWTGVPIFALIFLYPRASPLPIMWLSPCLGSPPVSAQTFASPNGLGGEAAA